MKVFILLCTVALASALPMAKEEGVMEKFLSAVRDCVEADTVLCLKVCEVFCEVPVICVQKDFSEIRNLE